MEEKVLGSTGWRLRSQQALKVESKGYHLRLNHGEIIYLVYYTVLQAPDYYEIIKKPMDLGSMMLKIDLHMYQCVKEFVEDIELISYNALVYNPAMDAAGNYKFSVPERIGIWLFSWNYTEVENAMEFF